jgi:hypothetical protein
MHKRLTQSLITAHNRPNSTFVNTIILLLGDLTRIREVFRREHKYAEHYTSYGNSFRIYGDFEEIVK